MSDASALSAPNTRASAPQVTLYYLDNFRVVADFVYSHYQALLSPEEQQFYCTLSALPIAAQSLCVRLLMRRGDTIRHSKIDYPEAAPLADTISQLLRSDLISPAAPEQVDEWLVLFTRDELSAAGLNANDLSIEALCTPDLLHDTPLQLLHQLDTIYKIHCKQHYQIFLLLFFGNLHQDLSEFVLRDLGLRDYEDYLTDTAALPFHSREQLMAYWQYYQCDANFTQASELGAEGLRALCEALPQHTFNDPVLKRRVHRFYNRIARQLERLSALDQAADIYQLSDYPPCRERLARIEAQRHNEHTALQLCSDIIAEPRDSEELEFALRFSAQVAKKIGLDIKAPAPYKPPIISLTLTPDSLSVERATALHFARTGHCYYVENSLLTAAFGLAFWDIIFAPVKGVFFHPFQRAPLDFHDARFIEHRKSLVNARIESIRQGDLRRHLFTHFHQKQGLMNPLVQWQSINRTLLSLTVSRIPTRDWLSIFTYLLRDIRNHRSGLPDLIYFPDTGGYQLLEVKGPGDALQKHQRRWMKHFNDNNIAHALVNVDYQRVNKSRHPPQLIAV